MQASLSSLVPVTVDNQMQVTKALLDSLSSDLSDEWTCNKLLCGVCAFFLLLLLLLSLSAEYFFFCLYVGIGEACVPPSLVLSHVSFCRFYW